MLELLYYARKVPLFAVARQPQGQPISTKGDRCIDAPNSICYIWQRTGKSESWTEEENAILHRLYPCADRETILTALPAHSWSAISNQVHDLQIGRAYQLNNSQLHRLVSVNDAAFMAQVGIVLENPYQRAWWIIAVQQIEERPLPYFAQ